MIMDFRRPKLTEHSVLFINREEVERVEGFKFLGVQIKADLIRSTHISHQKGTTKTALPQKAQANSSALTPVDEPLPLHQ